MLKSYELKNQRKTMMDEAKNALGAKNMEAYNAKMAEIQAINAEIEANEAIEAEEGRFDESDPRMTNKANDIESRKSDEVLKNRLDQSRTGNEYANAWATAMRNGISPKSALGVDAYNPLMNTLTISGGSPTGSDGGFLVPIDFDNMIHTIMKEFVRLADYFHVENVTATSGWRAVETTASRTALPEINEAAVIPKGAQPKFRKVTYNVKKYGDRTAVSSELLADNTAGLMQYLARWFGPRVVITENSLLLAILNTATKATLSTGDEVKELKAAINKGLNTAISKNAILLTNQSSYNFLDEQVDTNGRGLLVPNPADADVFRFKSRPVIRADDDLIPNRTSGGSEFWPIYIGYMKVLGTLFRRQAFEFATTNIGGDAWASDTTEVRGICRMDAQKVDEKAAIVREVEVTA